MDNSEIIKNINRLLYPYILLFGFYVIFNGHNTPGGGFQGGAILSAVFISRFLVLSLEDINMYNISILEKIFITALFVVPTLSYFSRGEMFTNFLGLGYMNREIYLIILNFVIGLKVACGLTLIFNYLVTRGDEH